MYKVIVSPVWKSGTGEIRYDETTKKMNVVENTATLLGHTLFLADEKGMVIESLSWRCVSSPEVKADYLNNLLLDMPDFRDDNRFGQIVSWLGQELSKA